MKLRLLYVALFFVYTNVFGGNVTKKKHAICDTENYCYVPNGVVLLRDHSECLHEKIEKHGLGFLDYYPYCRVKNKEKVIEQLVKPSLRNLTLLLMPLLREVHETVPKKGRPNKKEFYSLDHPYCKEKERILGQVCLRALNRKKDDYKWSVQLFQAASHWRIPIVMEQSKKWVSDGFITNISSIITVPPKNDEMSYNPLEEESMVVKLPFKDSSLKEFDSGVIQNILSEGKVEALLGTIEPSKKSNLTVHDALWLHEKCRRMQQKKEQSAD